MVILCLFNYLLNHHFFYSFLVNLIAWAMRNSIHLCSNFLSVWILVYLILLLSCLAFCGFFSFLSFSMCMCCFFSTNQSTLLRILLILVEFFSSSLFTYIESWSFFFSFSLSFCYFYQQKVFWSLALVSR